MNSASLSGSTGVINTPSAYVLPFGVLGVGMHRFDLNLAYGIVPAFEAGMKVNTQGDFNQWIFSSKFNMKLAGLNFGGGVEAPYHLPISACVFTGWTGEQIAGGFFLNAGWGNGRFNSRLNGFFVSSGFVFYPGAMVLVEHDGANDNAGLRLLLSDRLKLDAFMLKLDTLNQESNSSEILRSHVLFGLFYTEPMFIYL